MTVTLDNIRMPLTLVTDMVIHAAQENPEECCGMLSARDGIVTGVHPAENIDHSWGYYVMSPHDQLRIHEETERDGSELVAIYHSHPGMSPFPSLQDADHATPDLVYVIVGLRPTVEIRAWRFHTPREIEGIPIELIR